MARAIGRVATFYSYKGGVGRTMALANVAAQLAVWGYRVLAVDWDLEAPGLDAYFKRWFTREPSGGVLELVEAFRDGRPGAWPDVVERLELPGARAPLTLMRAGRQDDSYVGRVQKLDWNDIYGRGFGRFLEGLRAQWIAEYDFVLVDSRTGVSDTGGICTIQLPDVLVAFCTASEQSVEGVKLIARRAQAQQRALPVDRARLLVLPVPTRVDQTEYRLMEEWYERFAAQLGGFVLEWADEAPVDTLLRHLAVPYVPYWSYGEKLPAIDETRRDKLSVAFALETLAALLARGLDDVTALLGDRDRFVRDTPAWATEPERSGYDFDVFLSYRHDDEPFALNLAEALAKCGVTAWVAAQQVRTGVSLVEAISAGLQRSRHVVAVIGGELGSWQALELEMALSRSVSSPHEGRIIPVVRRHVRALPPLIASFQSLKEPEETSWGRSSIDRLAEEVARLVRSDTDLRATNGAP